MNDLDFMTMTINKPWKRSASGPNEYDCFGLIIDHLKQVKDIEYKPSENYLDLTCLNEACNTEQQNFVPIKQRELSEYVLYLDNDGIFAHCGIYIGRGLVLHASELRGMVCTDKEDQLAKSCGKVVYMRYNK